MNQGKVLKLFPASQIKHYAIRMFEGVLYNHVFLNSVLAGGKC
jgi:hypothetical protein